MQPKAIDPKLWGASAWHILHRLSFVFRNAKNARQFYMSLLILLPCPKCRGSLGEHLKKHPFPTNHKDIPEWCIRLHNMVNASMGKEPYRVHDMYEVRTIYTEPSEKEWTFIRALVDSHPGKRFITSEHVNALHTFFVSWTKGQKGVSAPSKVDISNKTFLQQWLRKNDPSKTPVIFDVCSTNTCEIRVGGN